MPLTDQTATTLTRLLHIMDELRAKCPWDKQQTFASLRHLTIEETYELADAILNNDLPAIRKELGDLLLHIVFYAKLGSEESGENAFNFLDIMTHLCDKLISRHPHVFGAAAPLSDPHAVQRQWEQRKLQEGQTSVLAGVPTSLPALIKALRIQDKAKGVGFDWAKAEHAWQKVEEEIQEFRQEIDPTTHTPHDLTRATAEFGDILFSLVNYARLLGINPETALEQTNRKFIRRFQAMEQAIQAEGKQLHTASLAEMDQHWERIKQQE